MKYLILILLLFVTGCSNNVINEEKIVYNSYIKELKSSTKINDYIPFDINIYCDKIVETEVMYRVIIDNPKVPIRDIEAIVIHSSSTADIFPTTGIFEEKYSLIPNVINEKSKYVEGIVLVGYIPYTKEIESFNTEFKVMVKYVDDEDVEHTIIYLKNTI